MAIATPVQTEPRPDSQIRPGIPAIFVHVRDVPSAVTWYSRVLGLSALNYDGRRQFYILRLLDTPGATNIIFQQRNPPQPSPQVLCSFGSDDIAATYRHMKALGVRIVREIAWDGSDGDFDFADPDGNVFMACKR